MMAEAFACSLESLEAELAQLIRSGQIQARIDSHNKARHLEPPSPLSLVLGGDCPGVQGYAWSRGRDRAWL